MLKIKWQILEYGEKRYLALIKTAKKNLNITFIHIFQIVQINLKGCQNWAEIRHLKKLYPYVCSSRKSDRRIRDESQILQNEVKLILYFLIEKCQKLLQTSVDQLLDSSYAIDEIDEINLLLDWYK